MSPVTSKQAKLDVLGILGEGLDTQQLDGFLDQMFELAATWRTITCTVVDDQTIRVQSGDVAVQEAEVPRARTKLRMACARLAVRCGEWAGRQVSPYGDTVDLEHPRTMRSCKVRFENTSGSQFFLIANK